MMSGCTGLSASSWSPIASSSSSSSPSPRFFSNNTKLKHNLYPFRVPASSSANDSDCNDEECAPEKEVGKVSMEWLAGEKTKVVGTFPPRTRGWTGYVEKDTAGQTNIYSIEPAVYVAESAISSGTAGTSADGAENTSAIAAGLALIFIAGASSVVLQVGKQPTPVKTLEYSGPSLTYYINKFKPSEIIEVSAPAPAPKTEIQAEISTPSDPETEIQAEISAPSDPETAATDVSEVQVESESQPDTASLSLELS